MLMGRRTYEFFAAAFPHRTGEYGDTVNRIRKYVFSSTLQKADWSNSSIVKGDVAVEVGKLKSQAGKDLVIYGHGLLGQTLLKNDLQTHCTKDSNNRRRPHLSARGDRE
jgi:dihydrofolate reductase